MSRRLLAAVPLALALVIAAATPAAAHTGIEGTIPADGETVTVLPERFSVTATEQLNDLAGDGSGFELHITDPAGNRIDHDEVLIEGRVASTPAVVGEPGVYTFAYQVVGEDGHPVAGAITFTWAPDGVAVDGTNADNGSDVVAPAESGAPLWLVITGITLGIVIVVGLVVGLVVARRRKA